MPKLSTFFPSFFRCGFASWSEAFSDFFYRQMNKPKYIPSNCMNPFTPTTMKRKTLTTLIVVLVGLLTFAALPQKAQAGHGSSLRRYHHSCNHCRRPVYAYRVIAYYNSYGHPTYRWVTQSHSGCGSRSPSYRSYGSSHYYYRSPSYYYRSRSSCRPSSGFHFSWRL